MGAIITPLIYVLAFIAVVIFVQSAAGLVFAAGDRTKRVNRRLTMLDSGMAGEDVYKSLIRKTSLPNVAGGPLIRFYEQAQRYCYQAGLSISPARIAAFTAAGAAALWLVALSLASSGGGRGILINGVASFIAAIGLSVLAAWFWIRRLRTLRLKKIEEQLPLALDIVNRAVRAGHPVISAVQLAADELGDPVGSEFGLIVDETTYGVEFRDALANFARRTGSPDAHFFAVSVSIQSETGGNLAEILEGLANVMRGRATLGKRVKSLASEGRASATLLSVLPVLMIGLQFLIHPKVYTSKFSDPIFWPVVGIAGVLYFIGWLIIHRIINFKY
ncbi:MAG TPA: type II secretion system F family protein [Phenylobacterium sp.]|jgi:tight adherence protein B|nr:type II secretion system F family protein [Phenylobacterium sp.]